jgi:GNAT superfamily N-acetyltransferase
MLDLERNVSAYRVRRLRRSDIEPTAQLLARTFLDNPVYVFMHPRAATRVADLTRFFVRNLAWRMQLELTWVLAGANDSVWGTATLEPPGGVPRSLLGLLQHWVLPGLKEQGPHTVARIARTDAAFTRRYLKLTDGKAYWHVHAVAIDESLRGQGHGSLLLQQLLRELDRRDPEATAPVLLSTQRERNLRLYGRAGFELLTSDTFVGCRSWFMRRSRLGRDRHLQHEA